MDETAFRGTLQELTQQSQHFLEATALASDEAYQSMLEQSLRVFTRRVGELLDAERASLFLVDRERQQLVLRVAQDMPEGDYVRFRWGLASPGGRRDRARSFASTMPTPIRVSTRPSTPRPGSARARMLCLPLQDRSGQVFAVTQLLNRRDGRPFDDNDTRRYQEFAASLSVLLESLVTLAGRPRGVRHDRLAGTPVRLLHVTDPHLFADESQTIYGVKTAVSFRKVLARPLRPGAKARPQSSRPATSPTTTLQRHMRIFAVPWSLWIAGLLPAGQSRRTGPDDGPGHQRRRPVRWHRRVRRIGRGVHRYACAWPSGGRVSPPNWHGSSRTARRLTSGPQWCACIIRPCRGQRMARRRRSAQCQRIPRGHRSPPVRAGGAWRSRSPGVRAVQRGPR